MSFHLPNIIDWNLSFRNYLFVTTSVLISWNLVFCKSTFVRNQINCHQLFKQHSKRAGVASLPTKSINSLPIVCTAHLVLQQVWREIWNGYSWMLSPWVKYWMMIMKTNTGYLSAHKTPAPSCGAPLRCCETRDSGGCKHFPSSCSAVLVLLVLYLFVWYCTCVCCSTWLFGAVLVCPVLYLFMSCSYLIFVNFGTLHYYLGL